MRNGQFCFLGAPCDQSQFFERWYVDHITVAIVKMSLPTVNIEIDGCIWVCRWRKWSRSDSTSVGRICNDLSPFYSESWCLFPVRVSSLSGGKIWAWNFSGASSPGNCNCGRYSSYHTWYCCFRTLLNFFVNRFNLWNKQGQIQVIICLATSLRKFCRPLE